MLGVLSVLSAALLRAPWADPDPGVRAAMWGPLLTFLRGAIPLTPHSMYS